jgi:hypothetical protein
MANQEQKRAIWGDLGKEFGTPPKDSDEYYKKMEVYYQILEELSQPPPPPPPQRMPIQVRRVEPDEEVPRLKGCCRCDCHRNERAPLAQPRRRVVRCDTSESDDSEFGESRLAHRARRINLISDSESSSDSESEDDEPIRKKKPVGRPSKKSTAVQKKKVEKEEKEEKKKKKTAAPAPKKKTHTSRA